MAGERLDAADVDRLGISGDRRYAVVDRQSATVLSARREKRLLMASAFTEPSGEVTISLPDGSSLPAADPQVSKALSSWLDRDVVVVAGRDGDGRLPMDWAKGLGAGSAPLPRPIGDTAGLLPVRWWDSSPLLVVAEDRADRLRVEVGATEPLGDFLRRFRPSVIVESSARLFERSETSFRHRKSAGRCVVVTHPQPGLERSKAVLQTLSTHHGGTFGEYVYVDAENSIQLGDEISISLAT